MKMDKVKEKLESMGWQWSDREDGILYTGQPFDPPQGRLACYIAALRGCSSGGYMFVVIPGCVDGGHVRAVALGDRSLEGSPSYPMHTIEEGESMATMLQGDDPDAPEVSVCGRADSADSLMESVEKAAGILLNMYTRKTGDESESC